jgi:hypothetical protein
MTPERPLPARLAAAILLLSGIGLAAFYRTVGCGGEALPVVASFSILGDLTQQIGGDRVRCTPWSAPAPMRTSISRPRATRERWRAPDW